ncbi:uncharacterized protein LOC121430208 [Lytechinus variegatus]|uniref:uncharacterized protein LOC121430208 n=1 Tax=Lytechinus variegatus TaxID=7654 RepID=UPI001BB132B6|nr:uncharacterized protein LOC121430208 [Lytechinus variegatus]
MSDEQVDDFEYDDDDFDFDEDEIIKLVSLVITCILGVVGNAVILVVYKKKKKKTSTDVLIVAQAIVDVVASVFAPMVLFKTAYASLVTDGICVVTELTENGSAFSSLFLMMTISVDRYLLVCRPLRRRVTLRMATIASALCVMVAILMMMPRTIYTRAVNSDLELEVNCEFPLSQRATVIVSVLFPVTFFVTMMITLTLYGQIYRFLRRQAKVHAELVANGPAGTGGPAPGASLVPLDQDTANSKLHQHTNETGIEQDSGSSHSNPVMEEQLEVPIDKQIDKYKSTVDVGLNQNPMTTQCTSAGVAKGATSATMQTKPGKPRVRFPVARSVASTSQPQSENSQAEVVTEKQDVALNQPRRRVAHIRGRSTTKMLLFITIYFIITWLPLIMITLLQQRVIRNLTTNFMAIVIGAFETFRSTNHVVNIFVYSYTNVPFRKAARKLFTREGLKNKLW